MDLEHRHLTADDLSTYAVKFQGCHWQSVWNPSWTSKTYVSPVVTQRMMRYKLCPTSECRDNKASGCSSSNSGEYFMDFNTYVASEYQYHQEQKTATCSAAAAACAEGGTCSLPSYCNTDVALDVNGIAKIDIANYLTCSQLAIDNTNGNYKYTVTYDEYGVESKLFLGPQCYLQGGSITMGLFSDDTCSVESSLDFKTIFGYALEYSTGGKSNSLNSYKCMSCSESVAEVSNDNDVADSDVINEFCETLYAASGKCEKTGTLSSDQTFCSYIDGISKLFKSPNPPPPLQFKI
jgi:hypothetical protein